MTRALAVLVIAFSLASCAATDRDAPRALQPGTIDAGTVGPAGPEVNSGDDTPVAGTGIRPSDSGLGLAPGFPVGRR